MIPVESKVQVCLSFAATQVVASHLLFFSIKIISFLTLGSSCFIQVQVPRTMYALSHPIPDRVSLSQQDALQQESGWGHWTPGFMQLGL